MTFDNSAQASRLALRHSRFSALSFLLAWSSEAEKGRLLRRGLLARTLYTWLARTSALLRLRLLAKHVITSKALYTWCQRHMELLQIHCDRQKEQEHMQRLSQHMQCLARWIHSHSLRVVHVSTCQLLSAWHQHTLLQLCVPLPLPLSLSLFPLPSPSHTLHALCGSVLPWA